MIGATTENPFFSVTPAIRSRVQIFELEPLSNQDVKGDVFLLSTVALKVRKAYLVVPAMAEAILVLPIPGGP